MKVANVAHNRTVAGKTTFMCVCERPWTTRLFSAVEWWAARSLNPTVPLKQFHVLVAETQGHDLDYQETRMRPTWEYRVLETKDRAALQSELTTAGGDGWELVSATAMFNTLMTKVIYTLFLKRLVL